MQGRIAKLAAGYGVDFAAAHQDDVRGLDRLLISRVYPEQPNFSAWDAADDAFARLEEARAHGFSHDIRARDPALPCLPGTSAALALLTRAAAHTLLQARSEDSGSHEEDVCPAPRTELWRKPVEKVSTVHVDVRRKASMGAHTQLMPCPTCSSAPSLSRTKTDSNPR